MPEIGKNLVFLKRETRSRSKAAHDKMKGRIMLAVTQEKPQLTDEELERRRDAVDFARVNCELEGLYITDKKLIDLNEQYARGEIDGGVIRAYMDALIEEIVNEQRRKRA